MQPNLQAIIGLSSRGVDIVNQVISYFLTSYIHQHFYTTWLIIQAASICIGDHLKIKECMVCHSISTFIFVSQSQYRYFTVRR